MHLKECCAFCSNEVGSFGVVFVTNMGLVFLCGGRDIKPAHAVLEDQEEAEMSAVLGTNMKHRNPLRVFQPAANQRLSCRKITCKAFPFVVEEQRVTSYFLLVKEKQEKSDLTSETLWIFSLILPISVAGRRGLCPAP